MDFVAIDFETANEKRDSACSIGISYVENSSIVESESFLIRPKELRFNDINTKIHGITSLDVSASPGLEEVWPEIMKKSGSRPLVAHNAAFDMSVLRHSLLSADSEVPPVEYTCTLQIAKTVWPELACFSLPYLANSFDIELNHHNAESDARACSEVLLLASKETGVSDFYRFLEKVDVSVGKIHTGDSWTPSSAPRQRRDGTRFELELPSGYDVTCHPLHGKKVVFTGGLSIFPRVIAAEVVKSLGGQSVSSVSKKTDYLVSGIQDVSRLAQGKSNSAKLEKAIEVKKTGAGLQIITEDEFKDLLFTPLADNSKEDRSVMPEEDLCIHGWVARSFKASESWKDKAKEVFMKVCGDSNLARIKLSVKLRHHFLEEAKPEVIERWERDFSGKIKVRVTPPNVTLSNSGTYDWITLSDEILHVCATEFDELAEENADRDFEYQSLYSNFLTNNRIFLAYKEISAGELKKPSDHFKEMEGKIDGLSLANVKHAVKLIKQKVKIFKPWPPEKPDPIPRYVRL